MVFKAVFVFYGSKSSILSTKLSDCCGTFPTLWVSSSEALFCFIFVREYTLTNWSRNFVSQFNLLQQARLSIIYSFKAIQLYVNRFESRGHLLRIQDV